MTGSSFRGPPDENVACVRIHEPTGGVPRFGVVAYFPRGRRGAGPRASWTLAVLPSAEEAEHVASALSDLLWHAREDGARETWVHVTAAKGATPEDLRALDRATVSVHPRPPTTESYHATMKALDRPTPPGIRRALRRLFRRCP